MDQTRTTAAVQRYLDELAAADATAAESVVRSLLERAAGRLLLLCSTLLHRSYPRLTRPPLNLESEEMLSAVAARMIKALSKIRPGSTRQFFALANKHVRWELNEWARTLEARSHEHALHESAVAAAPETSGSIATPNTLRMLEAIEALPEDEREVFELVRFQGMTHQEAADLIGVSCKTVQRRLHLSLLLLANVLEDLRPPAPSHE